MNAFDGLREPLKADARVWSWPTGKDLAGRGIPHHQSHRLCGLIRLVDTEPSPEALEQLRLLMFVRIEASPISDGEFVYSLATGYRKAQDTRRVRPLASAAAPPPRLETDDGASEGG